MKPRSIFSAILVTAVLVAGSTVTYSQNPKSIKLLLPQQNRGRPLMQALNRRQTIRSFKTDNLPLQELSNLLWAAWGVNRSDSGKRTAPSWANFQEIDIYVATADGAYVYNAQKHILEPVLASDIRSTINKRAAAPVNFVFVADYSRMRASTEEDKRFISGIDIFIPAPESPYR